MSATVIPVRLATGRVHAELSKRGEQVSYTALLAAMAKTLKALPGAGLPIPVDQAAKMCEVLVVVVDNGDEAMWINGQIILSSEAECGDAAVFPTAQRIAEAFDLQPVLVTVKTPAEEDWNFDDVYRLAQQQIASGEFVTEPRRTRTPGYACGGFVVGHRARVAFTREIGTIVELIEQDNKPLRLVIEFGTPQPVDVPDGAVSNRFEIDARTVTATWPGAPASALPMS